jgi:hypothetical protein
MLASLENNILIRYTYDSDIQAAEGEQLMTQTKTVAELPENEQVRMPVSKAGEIYNGHFIFFTNYEDIRDFEKVETYAVPRVIALNKKMFYDSGLSAKYRDRDKYGMLCTCWVYMAEEQMPPVLAI